VLKDHVRSRTTWTPTDSCSATCAGTLSHCAHVLAAMHLADLKRVLQIGSGQKSSLENESLNSYVECQFHGDIRLNRDVLAIVVPHDARHLDLVRQFAQQNNCALRFSS
jgi:hypothetical protein